MTEIGGSCERSFVQDASIVDEIRQRVGGRFVCVGRQAHGIRDLETVVEPCCAALDGPRKNGWTGRVQVGQCRLESLVPLLCRDYVFEGQPENSPPHRVVIVIHPGGVITYQPQSELWAELET